MKDPSRFPMVVWRVIRQLNRWMVNSYGPTSKAASRVLLLTTMGRRSGQHHPTPLQYEEIEGVYYVASARGVQADWYRNLVACNKVNVQIGSSHFSTQAELMTDPGEIADFLELRLKKHPRFMGIMLRLEGLPRKYTRTDLEKLAKRLAIVALRQHHTEISDAE